MSDTPRGTDLPPDDDERIDQLLRDAGARLRSTSSDVPTPGPRRVPAGRRNRWIVPIGLGAVAAAVALIIGITASTEETIQQVPAVTPSVIPDPSLPSDPDVSPPVTPTPSAPATDPPATDPPTVTVTDVGWDGDGSACFDLDGVRGCVSAGTLRPASEPSGPLLHVATPDRTFGVSAVWTATPAGVTATVVSNHVPCPAETPSAGWFTAVACGNEAALWAAMPGEPGPLAFEARSPFGDLVPLTLLTDQEQTDGGPQPGFRVFEGTFDLAVRSGGSGLFASCVIVAPDEPATGSSPPAAGTGWYESCELVGSDGTGQAADVPRQAPELLVHHRGATYQLEVAAARLVPLADAPMRSNGCDTPVRELLAAWEPQLVMASWIACDEPRGLATATFGPSFVQSGPPDGGIVAFGRDTGGTWAVTDTGTGIEPDPPALPVTPVDALLDDAAVAALPVEDVSELVRGWMDERPGMTIGDAIADAEGAAEGAVSSTRVVASTGTVPSVTIVEIGYFDDSVGSARYAVWTNEPDDGSSPFFRSFRWFTCARGVTESDGELLCV